jgi:hypothetical protein
LRFVNRIIGGSGEVQGGRERDCTTDHPLGAVISGMKLSLKTVSNVKPHRWKWKCLLIFVLLHTIDE